MEAGDHVVRTHRGGAPGLVAYPVLMHRIWPPLLNLAGGVAPAVRAPGHYHGQVVRSCRLAESLVNKSAGDRIY